MKQLYEILEALSCSVALEIHQVALALDVLKHRRMYPRDQLSLQLEVRRLVAAHGVERLLEQLPTLVLHKTYILQCRLKQCIYICRYTNV